MRYPFLLVLPLAAFAFGCTDEETPLPAPIPIPELSTIAEARSSAPGTSVHVEGFVSVVPGTYFSSTGESGFAIQDATGGIYVSLVSFLDFPLNAKIEVVGDIIDAFSQTVLFTNYTGIERLDENQQVVPQKITTGELGEPIEGRLVQVTGTVSKAIVEDKPYGIKAFVDDGSGEAQIYINLVNDIPLIDTTKLVPGALVEINGLAGQYEMNYEIAPRRGTDLVVK